MTQIRHICSSCGPRETDWEQHLLEVKGTGRLGVWWGTLRALEDLASDLERGIGFRYVGSKGKTV